MSERRNSAFKKLPREHQYDSLVRRFAEMEANIKSMCSEAYKTGDEETVWFCKAQLADLERKRASMKLPERTPTDE